MRFDAMTDGGDVVPVLRGDVLRRDVGDECVVWAPSAAEPVVLDPVARLMLEVIDGQASVDELALDVHEEVGVPFDTARRQVERVVALLERAGLLASSPAGDTAEDAIARRDVFSALSTPCSENASRLGTVNLVLQFPDHRIRVACDSRRGARRLRAALAEHHVGDGADDAPLGFVLTAPQALQRNHTLTDRAGLVLSEGRGLDAGLHALASHLTALLAPEPGTVRFRARALVRRDGRAIVCLHPHLLFPTMKERVLVRLGLSVIDRLALDIEPETGRLTFPDVPWPDLARLAPGAGHAGTGGARTPAAIVVAAPAGSPMPSEGAVAAALASNGLHGSPTDVLDAATRLAHGAVVKTAPPEARALETVLGELCSEQS